VPKVVDYESKKREIAHKALYAFAFDGFHKATLGQIARMCHIGRTTIYEYFKDKDEIFAYSLNQSFDLLQLDLQKVLEDGQQGVLERLSTVIRETLRRLYEEKRVLLLLYEHALRLMRENQEVAGRLRARMLEIRKVFERLLLEGMRRGELRRMDARAAAATLDALVKALVFQFAADPGISLQEVLGGVAALLEGLRA
jgi:AcrR family transcriptional regulator